MIRTNRIGRLFLSFACALVGLAGLWGCVEDEEPCVELHLAALTATEGEEGLNLRFEIDEQSWGELEELGMEPLLELRVLGGDPEAAPQRFVIDEPRGEVGLEGPFDFGDVPVVEVRPGTAGGPGIIEVIGIDGIVGDRIEIAAIPADESGFILDVRPVHTIDGVVVVLRPPSGPLADPRAVDDRRRDDPFEEPRVRFDDEQPALDDHRRDPQFDDRRDRPENRQAVDDHRRDPRFDDRRDSPENRQAVDDHRRDPRFEEHRDRTTGTPALDEHRRPPQSQGETRE